MFYTPAAFAVRLTGRWYMPNDNEAIATAAGSYIEIAFTGKMAVLHFDTAFVPHPRPHLWITVDNGAETEVPLDNYLRIKVSDDGQHIARIMYKGGVEVHHRWYQPLGGKIHFLGFEADGMGVLPEDNRRTIEFVGDSITEGVLVDAMYNPDNMRDQLNRPYQDDVTATYAYLTAERLNLRPLFMGYGAVGVTRGGCGSVPRAVEAYPFCFNDAPVSYPSPDYILINHGANDRRNPVKDYLEDYDELLTLIRLLHTKSKIICLSPFCGAFSEELPDFIENYNQRHRCDILFISSSGWVPEEPLHPLRDDHRIIADKLTAILKVKLSL